MASATAPVSKLPKGINWLISIWVDGYKLGANSGFASGEVTLVAESTSDITETIWIVGRFKMKKWIAMTAVLVFAAAGFTYAAQRAWGLGWGHGFRGREGGWMGQRILRLLDNLQFQTAAKLTNDQVSHLRQIVTNAEKSNIETRAKIAVDGIDLRQMMMAPKPDQNAVMAKVQQISELRGQMMKNNIQALLDAKNALSPEQQERIRQFIQHRFMRHGWGRHQGWSHGWNQMGHDRGGMRMMRPGTPSSAQKPPSPPGQ